MICLSIKDKSICFVLVFSRFGSSQLRLVKETLLSQHCEFFFMAGNTNLTTEYLLSDHFNFSTFQLLLFFKITSFQCNILLRNLKFLIVVFKALNVLIAF